jgi:hypothetical protein
VSDFLQVNDRARDELERIGSLEFNIFQLQAETGQNELVTAVSSILAREDIFSVLDIPFETFMRFIGKIQQGYNQVSYHNKAHAADLSQVSLALK